MAKKSAMVSPPDANEHEKYIPAETRTPAPNELEDIEHVMVHLAEYYEALLKYAPVLASQNFEKMSKKDDLNPDLKSLLSKPRIRLSQMIVKAFLKGRLPLINDIIYTKYAHQYAAHIQALAKFELSSKGKRQLSELWDEAVDDRPSKRRPAELGNADDGYDISKWPPPLPEIKDPTLLRQVYTHSSSVSKQAGTLAPSELVSIHNERLEFKGDSVIDRVVCDVLFDLFPGANEGVLTTRKSELVCNDTLWEFAMIYKMPDNLRIATALDYSPIKKSKTIADVFEAYVGGLYLDQGNDVTVKWLLRLYEPFLKEFEEIKGPEPLNKNAKIELYRKIGSAVQPINYVDEVVGDTSNSFVIRVEVEGQVIGKGEDKNRKAASTRAAMDALKNTEKVNFFAEKRRNTVRTAPVTSSITSGVGETAAHNDQS